MNDPTRAEGGVVGRAGDSIQVPVSLPANGGQGMYFEYEKKYVQEMTIVKTYHSSTSDNFINVYLNHSNGEHLVLRVAANGVDSNLIVTPDTPDGLTKVFVQWAGKEYSMFVNGVKYTGTHAENMVDDLTIMDFAYASNKYQRNRYHKVAIFNQLSDTEAINLTT
jgi:hypothetical protein